MKLLLWIAGFVVFSLLLAFAAKNSDPVTVRLFFDGRLQVPLVLVMLMFFGAGMVLGIFGALGTLFRQRREIARLKRENAGTTMAKPVLRRTESLPAVIEEHA